jgi:hypothetical protein
MGSRCVLGTCEVPPPLLRYGTSIFVRDFEAECPSKTEPKWLFFEWQAIIPDGTSIDFTAASARARNQLRFATEVEVGTADETTDGWTGSGDVIQDLLSDPDEAEDSFRFLRVRMILRPDALGEAAPVLTTWRVSYDCIASE